MRITQVSMARVVAIIAFACAAVFYSGCGAKSSTPETQTETETPTIEEKEREGELQ
ncbi:MAG: hypothetical protein ISS31_08540 [Kiritimatiellae bacterium]|nr:hypothetical protein [Kiritimatiellia bacterium]